MEASPDELREAQVHFELYRSLIDTIASNRRFDGVRYTGVEPEVPVKGKSADLVVKAELKKTPTNLLVIEVKRRTRPGLPVFDDGSREQAKRYAMTLKAPYYAVTDGKRLRLFKTPDDLVGNYAFSLDEQSITTLLKGISDLHANRASRLHLDPTPHPTEKIKELTGGFTKMLLDLLEELANQGKIVITQRGWVKYLGIRHHKGLIRIGVYKETHKNYIDIRLAAMRRTLDPDKFIKTMKKLSEVPGFQWAWNTETLNKPNTWKEIEKIITEEPDLKQARKGLKTWLQQLAQELP